MAKRHVADRDGVEVAEGEQARAERADDHRRPAADPVAEVADDRDHDDREDVAEHRDPEEHVLVEADAVGRLHRIGGAEHGGDHRDRVHQRHADDADHVAPAGAERLDHRRARHGVVAVLLLEGRRLVDLAADDPAGDDDEEAEQERDAPAPGREGRVGHEMRQRQEDRGGEDLPGLHALQREAREEPAPSEGRMLEDHRARARNLAGDGEALDQAQDDEQRRREQADLAIGRQQADQPWSRCP